MTDDNKKNGTGAGNEYDGGRAGCNREKKSGRLRRERRARRAPCRKNLLGGEKVADREKQTKGEEGRWRHHEQREGQSPAGHQRGAGETSQSGRSKGPLKGQRVTGGRREEAQPKPREGGGGRKCRGERMKRRAENTGTAKQTWTDTTGGAREDGNRGGKKAQRGWKPFSTEAERD
ncbi:hypothetical protein HNY73_023064 [Argiope bruennichi]|uniref:Uncharacterized protein n=1 Tax=Argiope bruennichi TaxID=94029 RepID=A0A8T0E2Y8_ARGBR|nr:hypothetical protein HNY73_023064 [Argiope bruennichi]